MARIEESTISGRERSSSSAASYIRWLLGGATAALVALLSLYVGIAQTEYLPPPPLANNICVDEKLAFLRDHPPQEPDFLVVGSSIAFRNIDSSVFARGIPGSRPLNGAFCGMRIHQAVATAEWFIERWPTIDGVLLLVGPQDFEACRGSATVFDFEDAARFVFEREPAWRFYLRYFDPVSFVRNAILRANRRNGPFNGARATGFTSYGDGPIESTGGKLLRFGHLASLDQACFNALQSFARSLSKDGRQVTVVTTPLHPEWKFLYDSDGTVRDGLARRISNGLAGTQAQYWNADQAGIISSPEAFFDAVHIRWFAAETLTQQILRRIPPRETRHMQGDSASNPTDVQGRGANDLNQLPSQNSAEKHHEAAKEDDGSDAECSRASNSSISPRG